MPLIPDMPFDAAAVLVDVAMPVTLAMVGDIAMVEVPDAMSIESLVQSTGFVFSSRSTRFGTWEEWIVVSWKVNKDWESHRLFLRMAEARYLLTLSMPSLKGHWTRRRHWSQKRG